LFFNVESTSVCRYWFEQVVFGLLGWIPSIVGIALRAIVYRGILKSSGWFAIQPGVILKQPFNLTLHNGVYLDNRVYVHACPNGIVIGEDTRVMYGAELHVFNFRDLSRAGITIGRNCVVGPYSIVMGHGGTRIGDNVIIGPRVSILPVNHHYTDTTKAVRDQGIDAKGIVIDDDVWIGAGATILDNVHLGKGCVIGAGSVVTKNVAPFSLAVGVPAKVIRSWCGPDQNPAQT
jgi:acetyltransferase-like isoleucine patch superfamily enzyme